MIELHYYNNDPYKDYYYDDIRRILRVLHSKGYTATVDDIVRAWEAHSEDYCAGWLVLPDNDDEIYTNIMRYLKA